MPITICFATNDRYAPHAAALIVSIMVNKLPEDEFIFYCFSDNLSEDVRRLYREMEQQWKFSLHFIEISASLFQHLPAFNGSWTAYFRLKMASLLPESLEKILYLDCDMIVMSSLSELFATDITGKYAAVVAESVSMPHLASCNLQYPYFNSGMMLFNLKQYRADQMEKRAIEFASKHPDMLHFADQDIFNVLFCGNVVFVPMKWNCIQHHWATPFPKVSLWLMRMANWQFSEDFRARLHEAEQNPGIIHFTPAEAKPWDGGCNSPFSGEYWKHAQQTPFYEQVRFSWRRIGRNILNGLFLGHYPIILGLISMLKKSAFSSC